MGIFKWYLGAHGRFLKKVCYGMFVGGPNASNSLFEGTDMIAIAITLGVIAGILKLLGKY